MAIIYRPPTTGPDATFFNELSDLPDAFGDAIDHDRFVISKIIERVFMTRLAEHM